MQWVMACGILLVGLFVYGLENFPQFYPLAMLGGMFWSIGEFFLGDSGTNYVPLGNVTAIPIMNELGIGLGMLVWGITNVLTGWACGAFF